MRCLLQIKNICITKILKHKISFKYLKKKLFYLLRHDVISIFLNFKLNILMNIMMGECAILNVNVFYRLHGTHSSTCAYT